MGKPRPNHLVGKASDYQVLPPEGAKKNGGNGNLTVDDLISALAQRLEYANAHQDLKAYFDQRAELLCKAFECDLEGRSKELELQARENRQAASRLRKAGRLEESRELQYEVSDHTLYYLTECLTLLNKNLMPGGIWLEGMPPQIDREVAEKYRSAIRDRERELKDLYRGMVRDLLEFLFPGVGKRTIPAEKLFEMGLPREKPDVDDYI